MTILPSPQQLRYLIALSETRHFGRAAQACAVTQSTLSAGLLALERQLDAQILDRAAGRHVVFTPLGLGLVERAREALTALEAVSEAASAAREPMTGPLRLGVIPSIGPFLLPKLMPALRAAFPRLRLYLREDTTARLVDRLASHRLDLLLLALPCDCGGAPSIPVARDPFVVALPPNHRLAGEREVPVGALTTERLLLLEDGHCLKDHALAACNRPELRAEATMMGTSLHTMVQMVDNGLGLTILPEMAIKGGILEHTQINARPLSAAHATREIALVWRKGSPRDREFNMLSDILRDLSQQAG